MQSGYEKDINRPISQSAFRENDFEAVIFRQKPFCDVCSGPECFRSWSRRHGAGQDDKEVRKKQPNHGDVGQW